MTVLHKVVREAHHRGYRVTEDGRLLGSRGKEIKYFHYPNNRRSYPRFSLNTKRIDYVPWDTYSIPVHFLAAYCFYGDEVFNPHLHIRHLNGDKCDFSKSNIKLGTPKDNEQDKPVEVRRRTASAGGKAYVAKYGSTHLTNLRWHGVKKNVERKDNSDSIK